jgi:hypothetical protein
LHACFGHSSTRPRLDAAKSQAARRVRSRLRALAPMNHAHTGGGRGVACRHGAVAMDLVGRHSPLPLCGCERLT